jgi:hypothetical protein
LRAPSKIIFTVCGQCNGGNIVWIEVVEKRRRNRMWSFEGSGSSVILSEHQTGHFAISGDCLNQDCRPDGGDLSIISRVSNAKSFFTLLSAGADDASLDLIGRGLILRSKVDPDRSHAMISYYPKVAEYICTVGVTVVICAKSAQRIFDMYKLIFARADLFHLISVEFIGLKARQQLNSPIQIVSPADHISAMA